VEATGFGGRGSNAAAGGGVSNCSRASVRTKPRRKNRSRIAFILDRPFTAAMEMTRNIQCFDFQNA
jgi:hypothetical protein